MLLPLFGDVGLDFGQLSLSLLAGCWVCFELFLVFADNFECVWVGDAPFQQCLQAL